MSHRRRSLLRFQNEDEDDDDLQEEDVMSLLAGVARADVTPPVGIMLSGYAARKTPCVGVHDDLTATALYLEKDGVSAGIVAVDVIQMNAEEVAEVRARCQELTGIAAENILLACSHTHGGPVMGAGEGDRLRAAYAECLRWKIAGALCEARQRVVPARVGHTRKEVLFAGNRRERTPDGRTILGFNPHGPTPRFSDLLRFDNAESGEPMALLFQYDCHGTTLTQDNYWVTADYPGFARRFIERQLPGVRAAFLGGCAGNQNPYPRGTFALAERHGARLGAAVFEGALDIEQTREVSRLVVRTLHASLPLEDLPSIATCREQLKAVEAEVEEEMKRATQRAQETGKPASLSWATERRLKDAQERLAAAERGETDLTIPIELQVIALDDIALLSLPGEIFFETGEEIRRRSPFAVTFPVGYANGAIGYVPTQAEVPFGGYEVVQARARRHGLFIRDDADAVLIEQALAALAQARDGR
ncbi:MAG: hypothetical protein NZT92_17990 [Abditibacteriales bacterium]|nr:hypothetical protein [Abditibacteriales bacterium]MDW8367714.1 hypothetical protein [Abditibacteriales bacterium]